MYGYVEEQSNLSIEEILLRITQEEVFTLITGEVPDINSKYLSFIRKDNDANCFFTYYNGKLYFVDFGHSKTHLDCFGLIMEYYNCNLQESLRFTNEQFKLGLVGDEQPVEIKYILPETVPKIKHHTDIIYKIRPFDIRDKDYWTQYGISRDNLLEDCVVPVLWYKFFSNRRGRDIAIRPMKPTYAFTEFSPKVKIYSPYAPKNSGKWIANVGKDDVGNIDNLPLTARVLTITKSYKDCRVLRNQGIVSCWFQNEGMIPNDAIISRLANRFDEIYILFDNDDTGVKASQKVVQRINSSYPNVAKNATFPIIENVKDASDFYKSEGKYELLKFLVINNLI